MSKANFMLVIRLLSFSKGYFCSTVQNHYPLFDLILYLCNMNEFKEYYKFFCNEDTCIRILKEIKEQQGIVCKKCKNKTHYWKRDKKKFECKECSYRTSLKKGTIMENSNLPIQYWLSVIAYLNETASPVSASRLQKELGHNRYEPIWLMLKKIKSLPKSDLLYQKIVNEYTRFTITPVTL